MDRRSDRQTQTGQSEQKASEHRSIVYYLLSPLNVLLLLLLLLPSCSLNIYMMTMEDGGWMREEDEIHENVRVFSAVLTFRWSEESGVWLLCSVRLLIRSFGASDFILESNQ